MKQMFNIYYINNEKAPEISLLFDNQIVEKIARIKNTDLALTGDANAKIGEGEKIPFVGKYLPTIDLNGNVSYDRSNRVEDRVRVVSSKSIILKPIYDNAKEVRRLDENKVGNLVKIKDVHLTIVNADDVMATKLLMSGFINQISVEGIGDMNLSSLMEVMFKDSAYVLCGELPHRFGKNEYMILKIPMSAAKEMESQYSISDVEIGKVTLLGIYRGKFEKKDVECKINRMMALNKKQHYQSNRNENEEIEDGIEEQAEANDLLNVKDKVHYIDIIAIIQDLNI